MLRVICASPTSPAELSYSFRSKIAGAITASFHQTLRDFSFFFVFFFFRAVLAAYGSSQARDPIGATAASLYHNQSNKGSELCL